MNHYLKALKTFVVAHKKPVTTSVVGLVIIAGLTMLFVHTHQPTVVYQPTDACKLLTPARARSLLGDQVISLNTVLPVLSGNVATSKCGYTDTNPDATKMMVAAVAVRSGVNDKGVQQNKTEFHASETAKDGVAVKNLGNAAYFDRSTAQLNILNDRDWIIISYGLGSALQNNTLSDAVALAHVVLPAYQATLPRF